MTSKCTCAVVTIDDEENLTISSCLWPEEFVRFGRDVPYDVALSLVVLRIGEVAAKHVTSDKWAEIVHHVAEGGRAFVQKSGVTFG